MPSYAEILTDVIPADAVRLDEAVQQASSAGAPYTMVLRTARGTNGVRYLRAEGRAIRDDAGTVIRLFGTTMDVTAAIVRSMLRRVTTIATLPTSTLNIMRIADDPTSTEDDLLKVLEGDPPLAARVLKVVNSAFYGRPREVGSTAVAMCLLGVNAIRNVALAASLTRLFRGGRTVPGFDAGDLWTHSVAVGTAARRIAERSRGVAPEEAMLAGLLHDIGLLVEIQTSFAEFTLLITATSENAALPFADAERQFLGATHEAFGQALCEQWRFPDALAKACGHHHDPLSLPTADQRLPAIIHVADILAGRVGGGFTRSVGRHEPADGVCELLGLCASDLAEIEQLLIGDVEQATAQLAA